jgi:anti-sigma B factor antagonist
VTALQEPVEAPIFSVDFSLSDDSIALHGELDVATVATFDAVLDLVANTGRDVVLELSDLTFLGSVGVSRLVAARQSIEAGGGALVLRRPTLSVRRVLAITGLDQIFHIETE